MPRLVSFDVDGTLIKSIGARANQLHREAFTAAFKQVFGIDTTIDVIPHHGSTDTLILVAVLVVHGIPKAEAMASLPALQQAMNSYFAANIDRAGDGLEVLPGVVDLLKALKEDTDFMTCLVTGNLEPIGWGKMQALGLSDLFSTPHFGGFGSDFCSGNTEETWRDRAEFIRLAAMKAAGQADGPITARFHIGDAPMDVQAAADAGAVPLGVTTGIYTKEQLLVAAPSATILEGLGDLSKVMDILRQ
ncbi:hypothetical protein ACKKBG_A12780 [Auxenochlorella protothecoides x Auxenochlorella symbiontica]